ncbi:NTP transferase domain-containing protein [Methanoregula sp.]|jgi:adenosylcobinamide-phosphate guanylyltransferase|uniref:NTP transferase domain-containing protein n=1 Tax=Methanoregula sp. TaxID=2052170 RepID=UPI0025CF48EB|nr:NTP transferase domain-containing protein [Methanoregula sp.]
MRALIMAGGAGSRLNQGEKPLILINNHPMIRYVIDAFFGARCEVVVATSLKTPMTRNWCRVNGIDSYNAGGVDYIRDMVETVQALEEIQPLFVSVSDIPCIDAGIITDIHEAYVRSGKEACSTWVPTRIVKACRGGMTYRETIKNEDVCPTGLNILRGDRIAELQDELQLVIADPRLALNVNTRADRAAAEAFLNERSGRP